MLIHFLKGITEEEEDRKYIIPGNIYHFYKGDFYDKNFKITFFYNRSSFNIEGQIIDIKDESLINIKIKLSKLHSIILIVFLLIIFFSQIDYYFGIIMVLWIMLDLFLALKKVKKIFQNICKNGLSEDELKYSYIKIF
jgi:hypothetical protein